MRLYRSGSWRFTHASKADGADACGICPVKSNAACAVPSCVQPSTTPPARLSSDRMPGPSGWQSTSSRYSPSPWAVAATARMSLAGRPDKTTASATAAAVAAHNPAMSRSTWCGCGISCGTRLRATASTAPDTSKITALVTVNPLSMPRRLGIYPLPGKTGATTTLMPRWRILSTCAGGVASSTITTSKSSSGHRACRARRSNLV